MAWPSGLPMGSVNFGAAVVMQSGIELPMRVTVDVTLAASAPSRVLVFRPTGSPLPGVTTLFTSDEEDNKHSLDLPLCDTAQMSYGNGTAIVLDATRPYTHVYKAKIEYLSPDLKTVYAVLTTTKNFVLTSENPSGDLDDMLLVPGSEASFGVAVAVPDTWSAKVDAAEAAAVSAQDAVLDSAQFVADEIGTVGTPANTALSAAIASSSVAVDARAVRASETYYTGPVLTFIDDDADPLFHDVWEVIAADKGIKISLAAVAGRVTGDIVVPGYPSMNLAELKDIETDGHEILSHSWAHPATNDAGNTPAILDADWTLARAWMDENFPATADVLVYPGGLDPTNVAKKAIARKHWRYAINTATTNTFNPNPADNWSIARVNGDTQTEAQLKTHLGNTKAANGWLVVMTHDKELDAGGRTANMNKLRAVIDYAQANGIAIMKFTDAEKVKGNAIAVGEHTLPGSHFVSRMGKANYNGEQGKWTPTLYGSGGHAGTHTAYAQQRGFYQVHGGMVTVKCAITVTAANWDALTAGSLRVGGLPFEASANDVAAIAAVKHGSLNLGAGYTTVWAQASGTFCHLYVCGNNVPDKFLSVSTLVPDTHRVVQFTMTYLIQDPAWV